MISRLSTRAPFRKPQPFQSRTNHFIPLSWFILWTIDRPIYLTSLLLKINPKVSLSNILNRQYFYSKNFFLKRRKGETLRPSKLGTFTAPSLLLSYKGKNVLGNSQTFFVSFFNKITEFVILHWRCVIHPQSPPTPNGTG